MRLYAASSLLIGLVTGLQIPLLPYLRGEKTDGQPLVTSEGLERAISAGSLLERAEYLYTLSELSLLEYGHHTRVIGSKGHAGTLGYIFTTLTELGDYYNITYQTFPAVTGDVFESRLVLGQTVPSSASPMSLTPPTLHKEPVFGPLVLAAEDGCKPSDFPSNTTGSIAFIRRGACSFGTKSENAGRAGAIAAVVFNNERGNLTGTLGTPDPYHVATFGISDIDAAPILKALATGEIVDSSAYVDAVVERINTTNIIAQTNYGDQDNCVMLGGHSDSVAEGPGINDDGTGSLTLLEIAVRLANFKVNNCVRFAWWAGEEEGLLGSDYYVDQLSEEENLKIRLFMDYDMLASPNYAFQVYNATNAVNPEGSEQLRDLYTAYYAAKGKNYTYIPFDGRSDYDAFIKHGIPGGGIATGAEGVKTKKEQGMFGGTAGEWYDPCYHQACDTVENLNMEAWLFNAKLVAHSVAVFARSFKDFPARATPGLAQTVSTPVFHGHIAIS